MRRLWISSFVLMFAAACADDGGAKGKDASDSSDGAPASETDGGEDPSESESDTQDSEGTQDTDETADTEDSSGAGELPEGCGLPALDPGTHKNLSVEVDGSSRSYELFVPVTYKNDNPSALVLNFHGLLGNPTQQADWSQFNQSAQLRGMLVAYPAGIGNSFNAGACCGEAHSQEVDDVGFARTLVEKLLAEHCIDPQRVYVTGMSNGGHMAHTLACEAADMFAAAASVTGVMGLSPSQCQPSRPISVIDFHGTADSIVSYGGYGPGYPPVRPMMEDWAARNGCSPVSEVVLQEGEVLCETWPGCDDEVEVTLCTIEGGGHCWFGNPSCLFGESTTVIHASEMIADMFVLQKLP
ncbi:MAG: PHB depolymerase family esterase [Enhygromyxa sp.]